MAPPQTQRERVRSVTPASGSCGTGGGAARLAHSPASAPAPSEVTDESEGGPRSTAMDVAAPQQAASSLAQSGQDTATAVRADCSNLASLASLDASASQRPAHGGGHTLQAGARMSWRRPAKGCCMVGTARHFCCKVQNSACANTSQPKLLA